MNPLSAVYGQVARFRRQWYQQHDGRRRQLGCPVVSVGNLVVGGSGKTPVVATVAELLQDAGYVPAILSRGYRRRGRRGDVVVVSDGHAVVAGVDVSGDEPQLLARRLRGIPVVVSVSRYDAGVLARDRFGANVLILDDGFQHLAVARTVDLLLLSRSDEREPVLPAGRLREPFDAARHADAILIPARTGSESLALRLGVRRVFTVSTQLQPLRFVQPYGERVVQLPGRVTTVAAIARPERFASAVRESGYRMEGQTTFRDHHWFSAADVRRAEQAARAAGADAILTTEKDAVRLERLVTGDVPWMFLPIEARLEPAEAFRRWLLDRIGPPGSRQ